MPQIMHLLQLTSKFRLAQSAYNTNTSEKTETEDNNKKVPIRLTAANIDCRLNQYS